MRAAFRVSSSALSQVATGLFLALSACAPQAGPGQVVTRVTAPPWKTAAIEQHENAACNRDAKGIVQVFVQCMERRGYRVDLIGQGGPIGQRGLPTSLAQIIDAPLPGLKHTRSALSQEELQNYINMSDAAIEQDSKAWITEEYDRTKLKFVSDVSNVLVRHGQEGTIVTINAEYSSRFVSFDIRGNRVTCVSYSWDPFNGYFNGAGSRCHSVMTEEDARQAVGPRQKWEEGMQQIRQQVIEHTLDVMLGGSRASSPPAPSGNTNIPGPSISGCNKLTTGSFVSGAMGNFWCD